MPGVVIDVRAEPGAAVEEGEVPIVLESMKMELSVQAPHAGLVLRAAGRQGRPGRARTDPDRPDRRGGDGMTQLHTHAHPGTPEFERNEAEHRRLAAELAERLARAVGGGGEKARERHASRGKLLPRERVDRLCDPGSPFQLSPPAAEDLYGGAAPGAGMIAGIARVHGREVIVVANDATVKGGTGLIFFNQATMSARAIPQIAAVMGSRAAGGAYVPAMSDETVIDHLAENDGDAPRIAARSSPCRPGRPPPGSAPRPRSRRSTPPPSTAPSPRQPHPVPPARDHRPQRRRQPARVQGRVRDDGRLRLRPRPRPPGRDRRQPRHPLQRERPQGGPLRRALRPAPGVAALPAEHLRLHGRPRLRGRRHRQGRGDAGAPDVAPRHTGRSHESLYWSQVRRWGADFWLDAA